MERTYSYQIQSDDISNLMTSINDVETDGRVVTSSRDPPGQRSVYILPGDKEEERYRLTTFSRFPNQQQIDLHILAANGFYYTGYRDRVKCFSCGVAIEDLRPGDDFSERGWHGRSCEFFTGIPDRNRPLVRRFGNLTSSTRSSSRGSSPVTASTEASRHERSSTYLGTASPTTQVHVPSVTTRPLSAGTALMSFNNESNQTTEANNQDDTLEQRQILFPCRHPINPHMRNIESRIASFDNGWDTSTLRASVRELAESGLYFLGQRSPGNRTDRTKCWYCNGGLQNWEYGDSPWFEHAKWFPTCEYLLQMKGIRFVESVVAQFPGLRRPAIRNPHRTQVISGLQNQSSSSRGQQRPEASIEIIDPREEMRKLTLKVESEMGKSSILVTSAEDMGFSRLQIKSAFKRQLIETKQSFTRLGDLVDSMVNHQDEDAHEEEKEEESPSTSLPSTSSARDEVKRLEEEKTCKICHQAEVQIVFLPCGHLVSCTSCAPNVSVCPVCKIPISEKIRTFAS